MAKPINPGSEVLISTRESNEELLISGDTEVGRFFGTHLLNDFLDLSLAGGRECSLGRESKKV